MVDAHDPRLKFWNQLRERASDAYETARDAAVPPLTDAQLRTLRDLRANMYLTSSNYADAAIALMADEPRKPWTFQDEMLVQAMVHGDTDPAVMAAAALVLTADQMRMVQAGHDHVRDQLARDRALGL